MKLKLALLFLVICSNVACSHSYLIKSSLTNGATYDELKFLNYSLGDVVEKKKNEENYTKVSYERMAEMSNVLNKELNKGLQQNIQPVINDKAVVNISIDNNLECKEIKYFDNTPHGAGIGRSGISITAATERTGYQQHGNIVVTLHGVHTSKQNKPIFDVSIAYDMAGKSTGSSAYWQCDSDKKVAKVVSKDILPLAIKEIGQHRTTRSK